MLYLKRKDVGHHAVEGRNVGTNLSSTLVVYDDNSLVVAACLILCFVYFVNDRTNPSNPLDPMGRTNPKAKLFLRHPYRSQALDSSAPASSSLSPQQYLCTTDVLCHCVCIHSQQGHRWPDNFSSRFATAVSYELFDGMSLFRLVQTDHKKISKLFF
jgi:hypothetical protein